MTNVKNCDTKLEIEKHYKARGDQDRVVVKYICKNTNNVLKRRDMPVPSEIIGDSVATQEHFSQVLKKFDEKRKQRENKENSEDTSGALTGLNVDTYVE